MRGRKFLTSNQSITGKMAWRSVAVSYFDLYPDLSEESLGKGVAAALKNFPPAAK